MTNGRYVAGLVCLFIPFWLVLAIAPLYRSDWLLENVLLVVAAVLLAATYRSFTLSRISYTLIFLFLCLHSVGAHYTYAEVPYDEWWTSFSSFTFSELVGWERNNFDRVIHFSYGLLIAYPIREIFLRIVGVRGFWGYVSAARSHNVDIDGLRADRVVCSGVLRGRPGRGLFRDPG